MNDYWDYIATWVPVSCIALMMMLIGFMIRKDDGHMARFERFVRIFLKDGATLKTWGLFISAFTLTLLMSTNNAKMADNASWPLTTEVSLARIAYFEHSTLYLTMMMLTVLVAFGAVAFKGQLPGGASVQINQDREGNQSVAASGPAPVPPSTPATP